MRLLFIYPSMGRRDLHSSIKLGGMIMGFCLEPLPIATLRGLTPKDWDTRFLDDRLEEIDYTISCDVVAISVQTLTARRAYEIASEFKKRNKIVIMGGFHPSILPDEALRHCDSVLIGEAEGIWEQLLADIKRGKLKKKYCLKKRAELGRVRVDRTIYGNKRYLPVRLMETGRGCRFACDFCSVSLFFKGEYRRRPIPDIISEIRSTGCKTFIFVDDNICADIASAKELFRALIPLKIRWGSSASVDIAQDDELLDLMQESGCIIMLFGFETLDNQNLLLMNKKQNYACQLKWLVKKLYQRNILIYGSFLFGYEYETEESIQRTVDFAIKNGFFLCNLYHLHPFPVTTVYKRLEAENRLRYRDWWLNPSYTFGQAVYKPAAISPARLSQLCRKARSEFYSYPSIARRALRLKIDRKLGMSLTLYITANLLSRAETNYKQGIKLGRTQ